jgi:hypothetical protein
LETALRQRREQARKARSSTACCAFVVDGGLCIECSLTKSYGAARALRAEMIALGSVVLPDCWRTTSPSALRTVIKLVWANWPRASRR